MDFLNISFMHDAVFSKKAAMALTGASARQLEHWASTGIVRPSVRAAAGKGSRREYSFKDLVALKVARRLREEGISLQKIRKSLAWLRRHLPKVSAPLAELRFLTNGVNLFVADRDPEKILNALKHGQVVIVLSLGELIEGLRGDLKKLATPKTEKIAVGSRVFTLALTPSLEEGGFTGRCLEIPAAVARGATEQECLDNFIDILEKQGSEAAEADTH